MSYAPIPRVVANGRLTGQTAAVPSVTSFTVVASDASFLVSANVNVTAGVAFVFTVRVTYTTEAGVVDTIHLGFWNTIAGALSDSVDSGSGVGTFTGLGQRIRAKAGTTITVSTVGLFTTVVYNIEAGIEQVSAS